MVLAGQCTRRDQFPGGSRARERTMDTRIPFGVQESHLEFLEILRPQLTSHSRSFRCENGAVHHAEPF